MVMFKKREEQADFNCWNSEKRVIATRDDQTLKAIVERDNEFQNNVASRGGSIRSSLTEEASCAATKVIARRTRDIAAFVASKMDSIDIEHARLLREATTAAEALADVLPRLRAFEMATVAFTGGQPPRPDAAVDMDLPLRAAAFARRADRILHPPPAPLQPVAREPLEAPNYSDLLR